MFEDKNKIKLFGLEFFNTINIQARQAQLGLGINKTIMFHQPRFITVWTLQMLAGFSPLNILLQVKITIINPFHRYVTETRLFHFMQDDFIESRRHVHRGRVSPNDMMLILR